MSSHPPFSRRDFLSTMALGALAWPAATSAAEIKTAYRTIVFTKPFQKVGFEMTAEIVAEAGWSGIECPVRAKGQVEPEKVEDDLPKLHTALAKRGLTLDLVTTDVDKVTPLNERVLRTAAKLGVKHYRLAFEKYDLAQPIPPQLANLKAQYRDLAALNRELGLCGGLQNHSGGNMIGAPIWDLYELLRDLDPAAMGTCFDIGHATIEGGLSWPVQAKLMEPYLTCVYVKDFTWEKGAKDWKEKWCPLGEGMVNKSYFAWLQKSSYRGPISQHLEYFNGDSPANRAAMKKDCETLKSWLAETAPKSA